MRGIKGAVIALVLLSFMGRAQAAVSPDVDFFKGKVISYIVATKPGGGYDAYARLIGRYMQKYLPGVTLTIRYVPGAGHIIGANAVYSAKPDGLTIGTFNSYLSYSQLVGAPGIQFDMNKYSYIGKASSDTRVFIVGAQTPYKSMDDILASREPVKLAAGGVGSAAYNDVLVLAAATGANIKVIPGYAGQEDVMAILRGEVAGLIGSYAGLANFIKTKQCRILLQMGAKKHGELKDVLLARDMKISEKGKKILSVFDGTAELGRLTAAPPNVRETRLQALRDAYKKALADPQLLMDAARYDLNIDPDFSDNVTKMVKASMQQPPENMEILKKIMKGG